MNTKSCRLLIIGAAAVLLSACGTLPNSIDPNITLTSPANNSTVSLPANKVIPVNFTTNYILKAPGMCAGLDHCGHVYVLVDSTNCNTPNMPYNTLAVSSPTQADLSKCMMPTGMHTITLELHYDDEVAVKNLIGNPVTDKVTITAQ
jgi:hypothetical protein